MHAQLGYAGIDRPAAQAGARHGADRATTSTVIPDLKSLKRAPTPLRNSFE
jgi:hypothetical protein